MHLSRAILLSTAVLTLAGVSAFGATPAETAGTEAVAMPANGESCLGADVGPEVGMAMCPGPAFPTDTAVAGLDDPCLAGRDDPAAEADMQVDCAEAVHGGPFPSPSPEKLRCVDIFDGDCFAGCCGPPGQVQKWAECCAAVGGPCNPDCEAVCTPRYCSRGPS